MTRIAAGKKGGEPGKNRNRDDPHSVYKFYPNLWFTPEHCVRMGGE